MNDSSESLEESPHARSKRNEDQTRDFFWDFEKIAIIKKHNELRRREKAANMQKMVSVHGKWELCNIPGFTLTDISKNGRTI